MLEAFRIACYGLCQLGGFCDVELGRDPDVVLFKARVYLVGDQARGPCCKLCQDVNPVTGQESRYRTCTCRTRGAKTAGLPVLHQWAVGPCVAGRRHLAKGWMITTWGFTRQMPPYRSPYDRKPSNFELL